MAWQCRSVGKISVVRDKPQTAFSVNKWLLTNGSIKIQNILWLNIRYWKDIPMPNIILLNLFILADFLFWFYSVLLLALLCNSQVLTMLPAPAFTYVIPIFFPPCPYLSFCLLVHTTWLKEPSWHLSSQLPPPPYLHGGFQASSLTSLCL